MIEPAGVVQFTILGEPASKANSRKLATINGKPRFIKSDKARSYVSTASLQIPRLKRMFRHDVKVSMTIFYATRRPDLDESVILDVMQGRIYENDRQVKHKEIRWGLDKENPRAEITVEEL